MPAHGPGGTTQGHGVPVVMAAGPGDPGALAAEAGAGAALDTAARVGCTVGWGSSEATSTDGLLGSGEHGAGAGAGLGPGAEGGAGSCGGDAKQEQGSSGWSVWGAMGVTAWFGSSSGAGAGCKAAAVPAVGPGPGGSFPLPQVVHDETSLWQQYKGER